MIGASAGLVGVLVTVWLAAPVMTLLPGWPSRTVGKSQIVERLDQSVGLAPIPVDERLWKTGIPNPADGRLLTDSLSSSIAKSVTDSVEDQVSGAISDGGAEQ